MIDLPTPASLGECVDLYHEVRQLRLDMQKEVDAVAERERDLKAHILSSLSSQQGVTGVAGARYRAQVVEKRVPAVRDWKALHAWVRENNRFDVLQKRVLNSAILDLWEADQEVPGCEAALSVDLSVTKVK